VYNLPELVDEPAADAAAALAQLYAREGTALLPRLRGDFSLVIWDRASRTGLIARDQLGGRPLHIHRRGATLAFASELRNLIRLVPTAPAPDATAVEEWLSSGAPPSERTLFEGIEPLEPASWIALGRFGPSGPMRYWEPRHRTPGRISREDAAEAVRDSIRTAVRRRAHDGDSTAVLLSGGIDSSSVAATATTALAPERRPRRAYTVTFPGHPEIDEGPLTAMVAAAADLDATTVRLASGSALAGALPYLDAWDTPPSSPNLFFLRPLLARARDDGIRVLLDGEGGDAVFWHAPVLIADRLRAGRVVSAWTLAGRLPEYGAPTTLRRRLRELKTWGRYPDPGNAPAWWATLLEGIFGPGSRLLHDVSRRHGALAGIEPRHPLLDLDVIELALSLPPELAFDRRYNRPVLRSAMDGLVPDPVRTRPYKSRFDSVFASALRSDLPVIARMLTAPDAEVRAYADASSIHSLLEAPPERADAERAWAFDLWNLTLAECWLRSVSGAPAVADEERALVSATAADIGRL
jgi:asparagine synthase (glutamine-hydrolysing)